MRIVTLNSWKNEGDYDRRLALMGEGLAGLDPDVVLLQEVFACEGLDTARVLSARLGAAVSCFPARLKRRNHLGRQVLSTSGLAFLSRAPLQTRARSLTSDPMDGERIAVLAEASGVRLLNLHLSHLGGDLGRRLRARQLAEALDWARADWAGPLLVGGDLNADLAAPELAALAGLAAPAVALGSSLIGAMSRCGGAIDHLALIDPSVGYRIDRQFLALDTPDQGGLFPSDHAAIVLDLTGPDGPRHQMVANPN